ncbi:hypothetical protein K2173_023214 [Erythroxylum novogranatense]|uniref:PGG domain-containing protein n=1 Tax=Erythroxylum novogranatense TaxID=1862640 RepID=A0AAV8T9L0_9ROSI|nr:hypothetical protein K2173_023214 [Erythroxylum novogranatense]
MATAPSNNQLPSTEIPPLKSTLVNYPEWSGRMRKNLEAQGVWEAVEPRSIPRNSGNWSAKNKIALTTIRNFCEDLIFSKFHTISSAKIVWDSLAKMYELQLPGLDRVDAPRNVITGLNFGDLSTLSQPPSIIAVHQLTIWSFEIDHLKYGPMYAAIYRGDWIGLKSEIDSHPEALNAKVAVSGQLLVHIAAGAGKGKITQELAILMKKSDLEIQDSWGQTALTYTAFNGMTKTCEFLISLNNNLVCIPDLQGTLPVIAACSGVHRETTSYLYRLTPPDRFYPENGCNGTTLLCSCIFSGILDVGLDLLRRCPSLTLASDSRNYIPFSILAMAASRFHSCSRLVFWKRWIYSLLHVEVPVAHSETRIQISQHAQAKPHNMINPGNGVRWRILKLLGSFVGLQQIYEMKLTHAYALEILRCMCCYISTKELRDLPTGVVEDALAEAVKNGIVEFVVELIKAYPQRMYYTDIFGRHVIMAAISYRQEKIYSLIYGLDSENTGWTAQYDYFGNNMLHLAGTLAPESRLASISGAALQMQRELQWFKEVESLVPPYHKDWFNMEGEKPQQIFDKSHKQLMADGEKWMKETATSSTVVGALIITVMFAAIFTVPSGSPLERNKPIYSYQKPYLVFIISDSISLFASSTSVLMFLGILTSRYSQEDFLVSLPTKLIIGLSSLFFSIASMMVSFCATLVIVLNAEWHIVIPIVLLASVPVTLFILLQFPLLVEIFKYTYGPGIFDKKVKQWY